VLPDGFWAAVAAPYTAELMSQEEGLTRALASALRALEERILAP
jgi:hypothetical protein